MSEIELLKLILDELRKLTAGLDQEKLEQQQELEKRRSTM